mmetsp:Transcript_57606/g.102176  ORF Transcript_57606/g.102176 Transcript_57606/m.102176 type:complete len:196 (-) Transcript_57606:16-603(-)
MGQTQCQPCNKDCCAAGDNPDMVGYQVTKPKSRDVLAASTATRNTGQDVPLAANRQEPEAFQEAAPDPIPAPKESKREPEPEEQKVLDLEEQNPNDMKDAEDDKPLREFVVDIHRAKGERLGIDVDFGDGITLKIKSVGPGVVRDWNDENPRMKLEPYDVIMSINGAREDAHQLLEKILTDSHLEMQIKKDVKNC